MSITVVIPCYKKSQYLNTVFESIRKQTVLKEIDKIIVSENSDDSSSKNVCLKFPDLKIEYIQHPKTMPQVEHLAWIIQQSESEYTAMLHDDDWWYPTHLEEALKALRNNNDVKAYFSNYVYTEDEMLKNSSFHYTSAFSILFNNSNAFSPINLNFRITATLCYIYCPFHMSTMVCRTKELIKVSKDVLINSKPFYCDRILFPHLAEDGLIVFQPQILSAIRLHRNNVISTIENNNKIKDHLEGSEKLFSFAKSKKIDLLEEWVNIKHKLKEEEWNFFQNIYNNYFDVNFSNISNPFFFNIDFNHQSNLKKMVKKIQRFIKKI